MRHLRSLPHRNTLLAGLALLAAALLVSFVARRNPPAQPERLSTPVASGDVSFQAMAYADPRQAQATFGFDIRGAGVLPVRVRIDNRGKDAVRLVPRQTFLIDLDGQAWPLLAAAQAAKRLEQGGHPRQAPRPPAADDLDALTGFALELADDGREPSGDRPRNPPIAAGQAAAGVLYFPGADEARGARNLRLCYEQGGKPECLSLPL